MVFIRRRIENGRVYYSLVKSVRRGGKVTQRFIKYLGGSEPAEKYAKAHGLPLSSGDGLLEPAVAALLDDRLAELRKFRPLTLGTLRSLKDKLAVEMTFNSNAIEGNSLSLNETRLILMDGLTVGGHPLREVYEAQNHKEALDRMYEIADAKREISEQDVLELHAAITRLTLPENESGFYRSGRVYISGSKHVPPPAKDAPRLVSERVMPELNSSATGAAAVESAAKVHVDVVGIHPFSDGNGRLARLLMNLRLIRAGFPPAIILKTERKRYYETLETAHVKGDFKPFAHLVARRELSALKLWLEAAGAASR